MVPLPESSVSTGLVGEDDDPKGESTGADPVRRVVHIALALYLTPVLLVVCLIGGASILLGKAGRVAERLGARSHLRDRHGRLLATRAGIEQPGPRFRNDREWSRVAH